MTTIFSGHSRFMAFCSQIIGCLSRKCTQFKGGRHTEIQSNISWSCFRYQRRYFYRWHIVQHNRRYGSRNSILLYATNMFYTISTWNQSPTVANHPCSWNIRYMYLAQNHLWTRPTCFLLHLLRFSETATVKNVRFCSFIRFSRILDRLNTWCIVPVYRYLVTLWLWHNLWKLILVFFL